jgi:tRNA1(Val) A37 N6-methylase TrmN6
LFLERNHIAFQNPTEPDKKKSQLGQFMTSAKVARFMASQFQQTPLDECRLLDPGFGAGSLSIAFLERWISGKIDFQSIELTACEIDPQFHENIPAILQPFSSRPNFKSKIQIGDFIERAVNWLLISPKTKFTHAIINPPYKKVNSNSKHRHLLRAVGIETVNLYSAFVALSLALLTPGGQLVAIIPRSFCNGPYFRPFRKYILQKSAIHHIHLFSARDKTFKADSVLQENVIIHLERDVKQGDVTITTSTDDSFTDLKTVIHPFSRIVSSDDTESFFHIPTSDKPNTIDRYQFARYSLEEIGITVSTGPVIDFRLKEHLQDMPDPDSVPLIYPVHLNGHGPEWPKPGIKKPNAIRHNKETEKWLYPNGFYCAVRRFSSKEEKRRITARVIDPKAFNEAKLLGFENHLNIFHNQKRDIPEMLARGLSVFLNSTAVDEYFRCFNGHTQVNATDLRLMKYPSRSDLINLGKWSKSKDELTQAIIDEKLEELIS